MWTHSLLPSKLCIYKVRELWISSENSAEFIEMDKPIKYEFFIHYFRWMRTVDGWAKCPRHPFDLFISLSVNLLDRPFLISCAALCAVCQWERNQTNDHTRNFMSISMLADSNTRQHNAKWANARTIVFGVCSLNEDRRWCGRSAWLICAIQTQAHKANGYKCRSLGQYFISSRFALFR